MPRPEPADLDSLRNASIEARTKRHLEQPLYYGGKWWARRLAVVTRWMVSEALDGAPGIVFDPFAGSGTTLGEALRLGHRAIGVEINPYAAAMTTAALESRPEQLGRQYQEIVEAALEEVSPLYGGSDGPAGYFWAYQMRCSECRGLPLLLHRNLLVKHAYPSRHPEGWALCPIDRALVRVPDVGSEAISCGCGEEVSLRPRRSGRYRCCFCDSELSPGGDRAQATPPESVLVAVERHVDGKRTFGPPSDADLKLTEWERPKVQLPAAAIHEGHSTEQILRWGFRDWAQLFHPRQARLAMAIVGPVSEVVDDTLRRQLALAFSPLLEYHCRLTSFKGLGTGSVRQAFGRPILHPVSISYEVNPVSRPKGPSRSGDPRSWYGFRTGRAEEALDALVDARGSDVRRGSACEVLAGSADVAILCADSGEVDLPEGSVDAIVTDPPYFDRVHYDDLAGPFNAWMSWCRSGGASARNGIQGKDPMEFAGGLRKSFATSIRALRTKGVLTFTYHHDQIDAWMALADALTPLPVAGLSLVLVPVEMPNALIKQRARRPIACDALLSFRKGRRKEELEDSLDRAVEAACDALSGCRSALPGDVRSAAFASAVLVGLSTSSPPADWASFLDTVAGQVERAAHPGR